MPKPNASLMIFTECLDQTEPCAATTAARLYFVARSPKPVRTSQQMKEARTTSAPRHGQVQTDQQGPGRRLLKGWFGLDNARHR